jgi:hypothetical protein
MPDFADADSTIPETAIPILFRLLAIPLDAKKGPRKTKSMQISPEGPVLLAGLVG